MFAALRPFFPAQQVIALRKTDEDWFILPDESDESINYLNFEVEIEAPVRGSFPQIAEDTSPQKPPAGT